MNRHPNEALKSKTALPIRPAATNKSLPPLPRPTERDPYFGNEHVARACSRYIAHIFECSENVSSTGNPQRYLALPLFISLAIHRAEMYDKTPIAALILLSRLKIKFPPFIGNGPHPGQGLFLTALMMASKAMRTKLVDIQSWSTIGQELFNVQELLAYERGMLKILGEDVRIDGKQLEDFERLLYRDYGVDRNAYPKMYPAAVFSGSNHASEMHGSGSGQNPSSNYTREHDHSKSKGKSPIRSGGYYREAR
ncbi:hypothetical protein BDQ17DRAFT_1255802 [Cyathus striatus]|nr:hypothetical protein BDQ17DRAFT_1255802 [Cyathus striatus]